MKLIEALDASDCDCAEYVNLHNIVFNIDGSGDGWYISECVGDMPPHTTQHFATREQAIASLPVEVAESDEWEFIESE